MEREALSRAFRGTAARLQGSRSFENTQTCGGYRRDSGCLVRVRAAAACHWRQQHRNRVADAGGIVLSGPLRERDDLRGHERFAVQHFAQRFQCLGSGLGARDWGFGIRDSGFSFWFSVLGLVLDSDTGNDARAEWDDYACADGRCVDAVGHRVREEIEVRNRNRYLNQPAEAV